MKLKLNHVRPICCAANRVSLSLTLPQYFVVQYEALRQQRFSSFAPALASVATDVPPNTPEGSLSPTPASSIDQSEDATAQLKILKVPMGTHMPEKKLQKRIDETRRNRGKKGFTTTHDGESLEALTEEKLQKLINETKRNRGEKGSIEEHEAFVKRLLLKTRMAFELREEYTGTIMKPIPAARAVAEQSLPWAARGRIYGEGMDRLNREIDVFCEYARPGLPEVIARKSLVEQIRADVRPRFPNHILEVFGSERTGLALALSDIDLRMTHRNNDAVLPPTAEERKRLLKNLYTLRAHVFAAGKHAHKYVGHELRYARYPLLSLQDRATGIDVQIVLSNSTSKSREYIARYMEMYPTIRQVYPVIKTIFEQRGLSNVYLGGFGSYSIFMMLVASLQNQPNPRQDAAGTLVNFLFYWAYFDTREHGISIDPPEYFDKKKNPVATHTVVEEIAAGTRKPLPDWMLCLRDPADATNDLGRKGVSILHVQETFRSLVDQLVTDVKENTRPGLITPLVGHVYAKNRERRDKLRMHGLEIQRRTEAEHSSVAKEVREEKHDTLSKPDKKKKKKRTSTASYKVSGDKQAVEMPIRTYEAPSEPPQDLDAGMEQKDAAPAETASVSSETPIRTYEAPSEPPQDLDAGMEQKDAAPAETASVSSEPPKTVQS